MSFPREYFPRNKFGEMRVVQNRVSSQSLGNPRKVVAVSGSAENEQKRGLIFTYLLLLLELLTSDTFRAVFPQEKLTLLIQILTHCLMNRYLSGHGCLSLTLVITKVIYTY